MCIRDRREGGDGKNFTVEKERKCTVFVGYGVCVCAVHSDYIILLAVAVVASLSGVALVSPHTFSAFWLRSSVVSVLLSLISEIWTICPVLLIRNIYEAI